MQNSHGSRDVYVSCYENRESELDGKKPSHARALESAMYMPAREFSFVLFRGGTWLILMAFPCMA